MKKYLDLLQTIKDKGTYKPAAREGLPGSLSLFGYQFRHDLSEGFPLLTTKKMYWKGVVTELLWFLRGDTNIKFLVDQGVNIWNEDAYQYYKKRAKYNSATFEEFINTVKNEDLRGRADDNGYVFGDCGYQYGRVWRNWRGVAWEQYDIQRQKPDSIHTYHDQIKNVINSLKNNPESRRHIVTAIDPAHDKDLALYWCHALFQFNCRPLSTMKRIELSTGKLHRTELMFEQDKTLEQQLDEVDVPKYYLDCQLYQRSADVFLGVPFNIASYALLTHIIAKICNMIPGDFIHSFGDVHIYDNHMDAVNEQLSRVPTELPKLIINEPIDDDWSFENMVSNTGIEIQDFKLEGYNPQPAIKAKLSTGLNK